MTPRPPYPTDLSDERWALIGPTLEDWRAARHRSALDISPPCLHELREIFNALLYLDRTGTQWRYLPHDFPPWQTVYGYFAHWQTDGVIDRLHGLLHRLAREADGRDGQPSAGAIDTQSVKTSANVPLSGQGTDVGKRIVGRKRGAITDTTGLLLTLLVLAADASDSAIGLRLLDTTHARFPLLRTLWADNAFRTTCIEHAARLGIALEVVQRAPGSRGFAPLPRRWTIERTFGWIMTFRRLARDYETLPARSAALIQLRMIDLMARRLTGDSTPTWRGA
ncbi:IS5 family transposase [Streptomyces kunmingensis]|uniref:IS5 family transposase n=1 Tax=Streptomyces kunmingensis TaxID=68225 RepID=A0ABU6C9P6_9ACTN|nr:IS5 family transposase [Streptomyces kunmingensis]MEB3960560.1 IS5 family transposase [Streptomyces kunmingensis]